MHMTTLKIATTTLFIFAFSAGNAFAGDGKDCKHKKTTAMKTKTMATQKTSVLSSAEQRNAADDKKMKARKVYTFDEALKLCQEKGANDLQACINYKTGNTQPKS